MSKRKIKSTTAKPEAKAAAQEVAPPKARDVPPIIGCPAGNDMLAIHDTMLGCLRSAGIEGRCMMRQMHPWTVLDNGGLGLPTGHPIEDGGYAGNVRRSVRDWFDRYATQDCIGANLDRDRHLPIEAHNGASHREMQEAYRALGDAEITPEQFRTVELRHNDKRMLVPTMDLNENLLRIAARWDTDLRSIRQVVNYSSARHLSVWGQFRAEWCRTRDDADALLDDWRRNARGSFGAVSMVSCAIYNRRWIAELNFTELADLAYRTVDTAFKYVGTGQDRPLVAGTIRLWSPGGGPLDPRRNAAIAEGVFGAQKDHGQQTLLQVWEAQTQNLKNLMGATVESAMNSAGVLS